MLTPPWWGKVREIAEPWPDAPAVSPCVHGWTVWQDHLHRLLQPALERSSEGGAPLVVVEVGAWLAKTSLHLLATYPHLHLVAIDTWRQSGIRHEREKSSFETWQANVWEHRDRALALRQRSERGMVALHALGCAPDLVYVDAAHDYGQVYLDVAVALACFPGARICGDDYEHDGPGGGLRVGHAVDTFAKRIGRTVQARGRFWELAA